MRSCLYPIINVFINVCSWKSMPSEKKLNICTYKRELNAFLNSLLVSFPLSLSSFQITQLFFFSVNQFWMLSITGSTKTIFEMIWADVSCSQCSHCFFPALTPYLAGYHAACTTPGYCMCQTSDGSGLCVWQQCFSPGTPPANPHLQGNSEQEI